MKVIQALKKQFSAFVVFFISTFLLQGSANGQIQALYGVPAPDDPGSPRNWPTPTPTPILPPDVPNNMPFAFIILPVSIAVILLVGLVVFLKKQKQITYVEKH